MTPMITKDGHRNFYSDCAWEQCVHETDEIESSSTLHIIASSLLHFISLRYTTYSNFYLH